MAATRSPFRVCRPEAMEVARLAVVEAEQQAAIERARRYGDVEAGIFAGAERVRTRRHRNEDREGRGRLQ